MSAAPDWKVWQRLPNASEVVAGLEDIPKHWSLTPLQDKSPKRKEWQVEPFIPHEKIAELISEGEEKVSKSTEKLYTAYHSGFGLRTGEPSGGLVAIDIDGPSAHPLLEAISNGDLPQTVSWSSGKPGRYQLLFQVPDEIRGVLQDFNRATLTEWGDLKTARDAEGKVQELLEFRYNRCQSALPPSRHPTTGSYHWVSSPVSTPVEIAPPWLCELLVQFATQERHQSQEKQRLATQRAEEILARRQQYQDTGISSNLIDFLHNEVLPRLSLHQAFPGIQFQQHGDTYKGAPPWRDSVSGLSLHVNEKNGEFLWQDKGTREGGTVVHFRHRLKSGSGTPKGKEFVEIVRELAADANLTMPEYQREEDSEAFLSGEPICTDPAPKAQPSDAWKLLHIHNEVQDSEHLILSEEALKAKFLAIKSPMKSGKTHSLSEAVNRVSSACDQVPANESILGICNTIALAENLAKRYGTYCYNDPKIQSGEISLNQINRLFITSESLPKVMTMGKVFDNVILDEADQVLGSIVASSTTKRQRQNIIMRLRYFASHARKRFVMMDADLSSTAIDFGEYLCGSKPYLVVNKRIPHEGETFYKFTHQEAHFAYIEHLLETGNRVLIPCDSKKMVKAVGSYHSGWEDIEGVENLAEEAYEHLQAKFPDLNGLMIHGDVSGKQEIRDLIRDFNTRLPGLKLHYLVFNSTVQSGVSMEVLEDGHGYFNHMCCLFSGYTLAHTELGQISHRWRPDDCEKSFSFSDANRPTNREESLEEIKYNLLTSHQEEVLSLGLDVSTGMPDPEILDFRCAIEARRNWSLNHITEEFPKHLESLGYEITQHPAEILFNGLQAYEEAIKARKAVDTQAEIASVIAAEQMDEEQYEKAKRIPNPTFYDRCQITRHILEDFTGQVLQRDEKSEDLVEAWLNENVAKKLTRLEFQFLAEEHARLADLQNRKTYGYLFDHRNNLITRQLLDDLEITRYLDPEKWYTEKYLMPLKVAAEKNAERIRRLTGVTITKPSKSLSTATVEAANTLAVLFDKSSHAFNHWLLKTLGAGETIEPSDDDLETAYKAMSLPAQVIWVALMLEKNFKRWDMSACKIHGLLLGALYLKRHAKQVPGDGKRERIYQIAPESWSFAMGVLAHREEQRRQRALQQEAKILEALSQSNPLEEQARIESNIAAAQELGLDPPELVFTCHQAIAEIEAIPPVAPKSLGWSMTTQSHTLPLRCFIGILERITAAHTPAVYSKLSFLGGCVQQIEPILVDALPVEIGHFIKIPSLNREGYVQKVATGQDLDLGFPPYIFVSPGEGDTWAPFWIPAEAATDADGFPVRRNPYPNLANEPITLKRIKAGWLMAVASEAELVKLEKGCSDEYMGGLVALLTADQVYGLQRRLAEMGISRPWLPSADEVQDVATGFEELFSRFCPSVFTGAVKEYCEFINRSLLQRAWQMLRASVRQAIAIAAPEVPSLLLA